MEVPAVRPELVVTDDVASEFAERVVDSFHARPHDTFSIALSGGVDAPQCYEVLARHAGTHIDWWKVDVYWTDEVCSSPEAIRSNHELVRESLLERVGAANASYPIRCDDGPDAYQLRLGELGKIDLVHLALGPDGTVAALFPDSPALSAPEGRLVSTNWDPSGRHPGDYITLTPGGITRARQVIVTARGPQTAAAVRALVDRSPAAPGSALQGVPIVCIADPDAAGGR